MKFCKYRFFIAAVLLLTGCSQLSSNEIVSQYSSNNSQSTREIIKQINYTINHRIEYQLDQRQYGLLDYWAAPSAVLQIVFLMKRRLTVIRPINIKIGAYQPKVITISTLRRFGRNRSPSI